MTVLLPKHTGMTTSTDGTPDVVPVDVRDNPPWGRSGVTTTVDANTVMETAVNTIHSIFELVSGVQPTGLLVIADLEPIGGRDWVLLRVDDAGPNCWNSFNITTGVKGTKTSAATAQINPVAGAPGRYRCEIKTQRTFTTANSYLYTQETDTGSTTFLGDITKGIKVFDLQIAYVVDEITLPNSFFGKLTFEVSGEKAGDPTKTYTYKCDAIYSCDSGVATLRAQGTPVILDPDVYGWAITLDTDGAAKARCRVTGKDGENWIWSGRITGLTRSRLPSGTTSFIDASVNSSVTADFVYTGTNVVVDGDMEAVGTAAWTAGSGATLSKVGGAHGGAQCLRVTNAGTSGIAYQLVVAANTRWNASVWHRTDGTVGANSAQTVGSVVITGNQSVWTQLVQTNVLAANAGYDLFKYSAPGNYSEFDDAICVRLPIASAVSDQVIGGPGVAQATAANRPTYIDSGDYFLFDGTSQSFTDVVPNASGGTIFMWVWLDQVASGNKIAISCDDGTNYVRMMVSVASVRAYAGPAGSLVTHPTSATATAWHAFALTWEGTAMQVFWDGVIATGSAGGTIPQVALTWNPFTIGGMAGRIGSRLYVSRALSPAELNDFYNATYRT